MSPPGRPKGEYRRAQPEGTRVNAPLAFITGASSGIGQALAERYLRAGWRLALVARRREAIETWLQPLALEPGRCTIYPADVQDIDAITGAGTRCLGELGLPDTVIANAGISVGVDTAERGDIDVLRDVFATNVVGMAATFQPFIAPMRDRRRGRLAGVASVAAIRGLPGHGAYCGSKAAVLAYCESLRGECRPYGVQVVTLVPGYVATPLTAGNPYPMPFIISADHFADRAFEAVEAGVSYRVIPWQMAVVTRLLRVLPNAWFDRLLANRGRKPRRTPQTPGSGSATP